MSKPTNTATTVAPAPFNNRNADTILRTADSVDFYVYKVVLALASPFFETMFTLPQCTTDGGMAVTNNGPGGSQEPCRVEQPVVDITETSSTIEHLLRLCYPIADPQPSADLTTLALLLDAAIKYQLEEATTLLTKELRGFIPNEPLRVYAIACRWECLKGLAIAAAVQWRATFKVSIQASWPKKHSEHYDHSYGRYIRCICSECSDYTSHAAKVSFNQTAEGASFVLEMRDPRFTAADYYRLLRYVRDEDSNIFFQARGESKLDPETSLHDVDEHASEDLPSRLSVLKSPTYPFDIILRSSDQLEIGAHKLLLHMASATSILEQSQASDCKTDGSGLPIVDLDEDGQTLTSLVTLIHPYSDTKVSNTDFDASLKVWQAAQKYGMEDAEVAAKRIWMKNIDESPLRVYFVAIRNGWNAEARLAAEKLTHELILDQYVSGMENSSAQAYYNLLEYHHRHLGVAINKGGAQIAQIASKGAAQLRSTVSLHIVNRKLSSLKASYGGSYSNDSVLKELVSESNAYLSELAEVSSGIHLKIEGDGEEEGRPGDVDS